MIENVTLANRKIRNLGASTTLDKVCFHNFVERNYFLLNRIYFEAMIAYNRLDFLFARKLPGRRSYSLVSTVDFWKFREFCEFPKKKTTLGTFKKIIPIIECGY